MVVGPWLLFLFLLSGLVSCLSEKCCLRSELYRGFHVKNWLMMHVICNHEAYT